MTYIYLCLDIMTIAIKWLLFIDYPFPFQSLWFIIKPKWRLYQATEVVPSCVTSGTCIPNMLPGRPISGGSVLSGQVHDTEDALALHSRIKIQFLGSHTSTLPLIQAYFIIIFVLFLFLTVFFCFICLGVFLLLWYLFKTLIENHIRLMSMYSIPTPSNYKGMILNETLIYEN
jgi:hypothetical protein